jgi:hypothetical protein
MPPQNRVGRDNRRDLTEAATAQPASAPRQPSAFLAMRHYAWESIFRGCGAEWRRCSAGSARSHVGTRARQPTDFLRKWPYSNSSTNSTHLNSTSAAFFSILLYSGMVIVQGRVKTSESSITASYIK